MHNLLKISLALSHVLSDLEKNIEIALGLLGQLLLFFLDGKWRLRWNSGLITITLTTITWQRCLFFIKINLICIWDNI